MYYFHFTTNNDFKSVQVNELPGMQATEQTSELLEVDDIEDRSLCFQVEGLFGTDPPSCFSSGVTVKWVFVKLESKCPEKEIWSC